MTISYKRNSVYGVAPINKYNCEKKVGKTTLFYQLIMKLYGDPSYGLEISLGSERGYAALDGIVYADCPTWSDFMEVVDDLVENKADNQFKLIAIDTVDQLVEVAKQEIIRQDYKKTGTRHEFLGCFGGYGQPRMKLQAMVDNVLTRLYDAGYGWFCIGHTKIKDIQEKNGDSYQMLTSNLNSDYDGIFANCADIVAMMVSEKEIVENRINDVNRYIYFRNSGYIDAGSRFPAIEEKIEANVDDFVEAITNGIKKSISRPMSDADIAKKAKQEEKERNDYYKAHKEELMVEDKLSADIDAQAKIDNIKTMIKDCISAMSVANKKIFKEKLIEAGLPVQYKNETNIDVLNKILEIVSE